MTDDEPISIRMAASKSPLVELPTVRVEYLRTGLGTPTSSVYVKPGAVVAVRPHTLQLRVFTGAPSNPRLEEAAAKAWSEILLDTAETLQVQLAPGEVHARLWPATTSPTQFIELAIHDARDRHAVARIDPAEIAAYGGKHEDGLRTAVVLRSGEKIYVFDAADEIAAKLVAMGVAAAPVPTTPDVAEPVVTKQYCGMCLEPRHFQGGFCGECGSTRTTKRCKKKTCKGELWQLPPGSARQYKCASCREMTPGW